MTKKALQNQVTEETDPRGNTENTEHAQTEGEEGNIVLDPQDEEDRSLQVKGLRQKRYFREC